jgi:hypothetical protein
LNTPLMKFDGKEKIRKERSSKWKIEMQWKLKTCFLYFNVDDVETKTCW